MGLAIALTVPAVGAGQVVWHDQQSLSPPELATWARFGERVAADGDLVAALAPDNRHPRYTFAEVQVPDRFAYVYARREAGWQRTAAYRFEGARSVTVDDGRVAVGAPSRDVDGVWGAGRVFVRRTGPIYHYLEGPIDAPDPEAGLAFGADVDLDGDRIVVGAPGGGPHRQAGTGYVFAHVGGPRPDDWQVVDQLEVPTADLGEQAGTAVALDGDVAVLGAPEDDDAAEDAGAIHVFARSDGAWNLSATLRAPRPEAGDRLGAAVAVGPQTIVAGAPGSEVVHVFDRSDRTWQSALSVPGADRFGARLALDGDRLVVGAPGADGGRGAAFVYERRDGAWRRQVRLAPRLADDDARLGSGVGVSDSDVAVGAPRDGDGTVHLFAPCVLQTSRVCVRVVLRERLGTLHRGPAPGQPTVGVERGAVNVSAGATFAEQDVVLARLDGHPDRDRLNRSVGPVETTYDREADLGELHLGDGPGDGELWRARLRVVVDGNTVTDAPFLTVRGLD